MKTNIKLMTAASLIALVAISAWPLAAKAESETESGSNGLKQRIQEFRKVRVEAESISKDDNTLRASPKPLGENLLAKRKEQALKMIEVLTEHAQNLKTKITANTNIPDVKKTELIKVLDDRIANLASIKAEVEAVTTVQQLRTIMAKLNQLKKNEEKIKARLQIVLSHIAQFEKAMIGRAVSKYTRIETKLNQLKTAGKDTVALEAKLAEAKAKIDQAKADLQTLKDKVNLDQTVKNPSDIQAELTKIKDLIKAAYDLMQQVVNGMAALK